MNKLSCLIPTYNCEATIEQTIRSVQWVDEIIIIDSYSTDRTIEIVQEFTDAIYFRKYDTPSQQKNWALAHCSYPWVLQLDSDEYLMSSAEEEIRMVLGSNTENEITLYTFPRKNHVLGKWVKYGDLYPDYQTRLFYSPKARFNDRIVHEKIETTGRVGRLSTPIIHNGMPTISKQLGNLDRYTRYEAEEKLKQGIEPTLWQMYIKPIALFLIKYVLKRGFLDGWRGLFLALYASFYSYITMAKVKELMMNTHKNSIEH